MVAAVGHAGITVVGLVIILAGLALAVFPRGFAFLAGPRAGVPELNHWNRYQGLGLMLLGAAFVMTGSHGDVVPVLALATVACLMFALAVVRRGQTPGYHR